MSSHTDIDLNNTIGALEIGSVVGIFLFGVVSLQTYNYYDTYKEDGWVNKSVVAATWFLELGHTLGISYEVYHSTIILYGKPELLVKFEAIGAVVVFGGGITLLVQGFFAFRLAKLFTGPYKYIGAICTGISFLRFIASIYLTVIGITVSSLLEYKEECGWLISTTFSVSAAVDIIIAGSMLYYLAKKRGKEMERISGLLNRLVTYTIRSGLLTSVAAVSLVICLQTMPNNLVWLAVYTFVTKLYSNSLLSALNSRKQMREEVFRSSLFRGRKNSGQDTNLSHDQPPIPLEMMDARERMNGNPALYLDKSKLQPMSSLGVYRISESDEETTV